MMRPLLLACALFLGSSVGAAAADDPNDPFEDWNRAVFNFNEKADRYVLKPVAEGYDAITPSPIQSGVRNFFNNLGEPVTMVNALLQGKPSEAVRSLTRFIFNSTVGLYGVIDVAGGVGIERQKEDFSQTLAVWGVGSGPYLVLPLLGPSDVRGLGGRLIDRPLNPVQWQDEVGASELFILNGVQTRTDLLGVDAMATGDPYVLMRSAYQQRRDFEIKDGIVVDIFLDDPFLMDEELLPEE